MLYQDYVDLTTNLPPYQHKADFDEILNILMDYTDQLPSLPYEALLRIRRFGYISGEDLSALLHQYGIRNISISSDTAKNLKKLNIARGGKVKRIRVHNVNIEKTPRRLLQEFSRYTGVRWRNGAPAYPSAVSTQLSLPVPKANGTKPNGSLVTQDQIVQWNNMYKSWIGPGQPEAALQHFLSLHTDYTAVRDEELVSAIQSAWLDGTLDLSWGTMQVATWTATTLKMLPTTIRVYEKTLRLFWSADRINRAFISCAGMSFAKARAAAEQIRNGYTTAPKAKEKTEQKVLTIMLEGVEQHKIDAIGSVLYSLGITYTLHVND